MKAQFHFAKYPIVRQYDRADCGPASLLSVLLYYGGNSDLVHMRELCGTNPAGTTMLSMVEAARKSGFEAFGASGEYEDLLKESMPCIAHVIADSFNHYIVVYKISAAGVYVADPAKGRYFMKKQDFISIWQSRSVILLKPAGSLMKRKTIKWFEWICPFIRKEETWLYQSVFLGLIYTITGLLTAVFIQKIIDQFIPGRNVDKIIYTGLFLTVLMALKSGVNFLRQKFLIVLNRNINLSLNAEFLEHIFDLPQKFFDSRKTGDITSRLQDALKIQQTIITLAGSGIIDLLIITGSTLLVFHFSTPLAIISILVLPAYLSVLLSFSAKIKAEQNEVMKSYSLVESTYIDSLTGIHEIIGFSAGRAFSMLNISLFRYFQDRVRKLGMMQAIIGSAAEISGNLIVLGILIWGAVMVTNEGLMLGKMIAAYSLLAGVLPSVNRIVENWISIQGASIAATRIMDLLLSEKENNAGAAAFDLIEAVKVRGARFGWTKQKPVFSGIDMDIRLGRITALCGPSGAGKSTLVQLLQRKYALESGTIYIDNIPAESSELTEYRKNFAVVPQDIKLFNGTIAENILLGRTASSLSEVQQKIQIMGFGYFLDRFPANIMTPLGEDNVHLSGGERQILALIRALYDEPRILMIDEGLSGIDMELEEQIFGIIREYSARHAVLLITHNIRMILRSDYVYLLGNGKIIQEGIPAMLTADGGVLGKMYRQQKKTFDICIPSE